MRLWVSLQTGAWVWVRRGLEFVALAAAWIAVYSDYDEQKVAACAGTCTATIHPRIGVVVTVAVVVLEIAIWIGRRQPTS